MPSRRPINRVSSRRRSQPAADPNPTSAPGGTEPLTATAASALATEDSPASPRRRRVPRPRMASTAHAVVRGLPGSVRARWLVAVVAAVVLTAFAVVAAYRPGVGDGNAAFVKTAATDQVRAATDTALKTIYSYDVANVDGYANAVRQVVTGPMRAQFDQYADTTVSAIKQAQSKATATADPIAVTLLTSDRAELLVNLTVAATKNGAPQESAAGPITVRMEKVGGRWLAAEIADR